MIYPPEVLTEAHQLEVFECGRPSLNRWLQRRARSEQQARNCIVVVSHEDGRVIGFCALSRMAIEAMPATRFSWKERPATQSALFISRLATDRAYSRRGVASTLVTHVLLRAVLLGLVLPEPDRALMVQGLDNEGVAFWRKWGFIEVPSSPFHLFRPLRDIAVSLKAVDLL